jgi:hypothetical protein
MELPGNILDFLKLLDDEKSKNRPDFASDLRPKNEQELSNLLQITTTEEDVWKTDIGMIALWRSLISLIPASTLEKPKKTCRSEIERRLEHLLGAKPSEDTILPLVRIVKRIQDYLINGRKDASSLNLERPTHKDLLAEQNSRCSNCGYKFKSQDIKSDWEDYFEKEDNLEDQVTASNPIIRAPETFHRKAVLDHIIPFFLGGDSKANWQILCNTCNSGKGDMVFGIEGKNWFGSLRRNEFHSVSPQLFYMVLNRDRNCRVCSRSPRQTSLYLVRKDKNGNDSYTNPGLNASVALVLHNLTKKLLTIPICRLVFCT